MTAHTWTPDEDARIARFVGRRIPSGYISWLARDLGRHRAQVVRRRRALRRLLRRGR